MKRKIMRRCNLLITCFLCQLFFLYSCTACKHCSRTLSSDQFHSDYSVLVDDSVKNLIGDSIVSIVFAPSKVELYRLSLSPISKDTTKKDSLVAFHDFFIAENRGNLSEYQLSPILFLLSDRDTYPGIEALVTTPFSPYAALRFRKDDASVDIVFSISGGRIKIYTQDTVSSEIKYAQERLFIKYFQSALGDERLARLLQLL